jgi:DNA helicase-2/ATP-dependent DNA helicase PcrA
LNVVDGCIPSDRATSTSEEIEEERRLLYVAMTRAKDELDLIVNRFFTHQQAKLGDRHVYATRCRFIPESILDSFASRSWWDHTDSQIEARKKARSSVDVAASLIWMWR